MAAGAGMEQAAHQSSQPLGLTRRLPCLATRRPALRLLLMGSVRPRPLLLLPVRRAAGCLGLQWPLASGSGALGC